MRQTEGQTDRQTDGHTDWETLYTFTRLNRGKKFFLTVKNGTI